MTQLNLEIVLVVFVQTMRFAEMQVVGKGLQKKQTLQ